MPNAISNKNILHVGSSSSLVVTSAMEAVGDKCKTRRHDVDFKQWIQYYDAYSVKRSSSRRVLLYVYAVCLQSLYLWSSVCTFCSLMNYFHALHVCLCWFFLFALLRYVPNVLYFKRMWRCILIFLKWIKYHDVKERRLFVWCIISAPMIFNAHFALISDVSKKPDENMFYNLLPILHHSEQKAEATVCVSFPSEIFEMLTQEDNVKHTKHVFLNNAVQPALKTTAHLWCFAENSNNSCDAGCLLLSTLVFSCTPYIS